MTNNYSIRDRRTANLETLATCETLPQLNKLYEEMTLDHIRTTGSADLYIIIENAPNRLDGAFEVHNNYLYFAFTGCNVRRAAIVDTIPAGYSLFNTSLNSSDYLLFAKSEGHGCKVLDYIAIKFNSEDMQIIHDINRRYYLPDLASCNRAKRADRRAAAEKLIPIYNKYYHPGTKRAAAAAALSKSRITQNAAEENGRENRRAAAYEEYERAKETARELAYKKQHAADLATITTALETITAPTPEIYGIIVWSENAALHRISQEYAEETNTPAPLLPLPVLDAIIKGLETNAINAPGGYDKTKIIIYFPGGSYEMRYDIESSPEYQEHGLLNHIRDHINGCHKMPEKYRQTIDFAGLENVFEIVRAALGAAPSLTPPAVCGKLIKKISSGAAFKLFKNGSPVPGVFYALHNGAIKYRKTPAAALENVTHTPAGKLATIAANMLNGCGVAIFPEI